MYEEEHNESNDNIEVTSNEYFDKEEDNEFLNEEEQVHKCSVCGIVKELFVFNKYTQICGDCYCEESTRLAKEYYADIKAQENLRLQIRKSIDEQNNHQRRMEG